MRKIADVKYAADLLQWDQEVNMPDAGASFRARQIATLSSVSHRWFTAAPVGRILKTLLKDKSLSEKEIRNVKESFRKHEEQRKYPGEFVLKLNRKIPECFHVWQKAKAEKKFSLFKPHLDELLQLKREECELLGYDDHPYNALLGLYEPDSTVAQLNSLFEKVKAELIPFAQKIFSKPVPDTSFLTKHYDRDRQWNFGMYLLKNLNYDFNAGRQDISTHPFTTNFNAGDVRITTRINESDFREMTWSTVHECGHALYEQGLPAEDYGLPSGEYLSLAIHESQSRMWENNVARSLPFWEFHYPELQKLFPENLKNIPLEKFYKGINTVTPSLIRTNADEITYHLHVLIRFEIECALIKGDMKTDDLPDAWNEKYSKYLGIEVTDDASGVLQDVHWSHGGFGYFPTYSQGSFYAAQFYLQSKRELNDLDAQLKSGSTAGLLQWLRNNIHVHGRTLTADELCRRISGEPLNFSNFMHIISQKYSAIYEL